MSSTTTTLFVPARAWTFHIAPHPADLALSPPESYLFIQDALILLCALSYTLGYIELIKCTFRGGKCAVGVHVLCVPSRLLLPSSLLPSTRRRLI